MNFNILIMASPKMAEYHSLKDILVLLGTSDFRQPGTLQLALHVGLGPALALVQVEAASEAAVVLDVARRGAHRWKRPLKLL